ncbi:MAG: tRNA uridine-5-carboxymethylaminomethyl(34) synthesis GTPase MnmE, partial [Clostridia bacterium]|nr:tRNA uridine-5-carboxymethylaminomethyl(34) synthesis GTPase MnmE [Clostridia bacterium]
ISCHGGVYITSRILRCILDNGASLAEPGEFTKRAFLNGKIDLTESEAVMDMISAKGKAAARSALGIREGKLRKSIDEVKNMLVDSAAHLSAWADYPEDDIPEVSTDTLLEDIQNACGKLETLINSFETGKALKEGIDTLIVGKPNVGKSTLMNFLAGFDKSIVTEIPGTTRDIIQETVVLGNAVLLLSDTAGLRDTDNPIEKIGVERAKEKLQSCGLVLAVFDGSRMLDDDDINTIKLLDGIPCIAIINKSDLNLVLDINYIQSYIKDIVYISASKCEGLDELISTVEKVTGTHNIDENAVMLSNERQRECVVNAVNSLKDAVSALVNGFTLDAVTVSVEEAIQFLLELTGENVSEVVVHSVFSKFCVGK